MGNSLFEELARSYDSPLYKRLQWYVFLVCVTAVTTYLVSGWITYVSNCAKVKQLLDPATQVSRIEFTFSTKEKSTSPSSKTISASKMLEETDLVMDIIREGTSCSPDRPSGNWTCKCKFHFSGTSLEATIKRELDGTEYIRFEPVSNVEIGCYKCIGLISVLESSDVLNSTTKSGSKQVPKSRIKMPPGLLKTLSE